MTYQVHLTYRAERDVDRILQWLSERSAQGATTWDRRWQQVLGDLRTSAAKYDLAPENEDHDEQIRHVTFKTRRGKKYRAIFVIRGDLALVTHVRGPGQDLVSSDEIHLP